MDKLFNQMSVLLNYPRSNYFEVIDEMIKILEQLDSTTALELQTFRDEIKTLTAEQLEELYTKTFDIQGLCCLDLGYVLFGEDYKRGEFLVHVSRLQRENNVNVESELADHLPNVVKLVGTLGNDDPFKKEFVEKLLQPAVVKMIENFERGNNMNNSFKRPLIILQNVLNQNYIMNDTVLKGAPLC